MLYLNLLLRFWREAAIGVLVLALGLLYYRVELLNAQKETLVTQKETLSTKLDECTAGTKKLVEAIDAQNVAIDKLRIDADNSTKRWKTEINRANATASGFKQMANGLLNQPPDPRLNTCENADALINREIQRVQK